MAPKTLNKTFVTDVMLNCIRTA